MDDTLGLVTDGARLAAVGMGTVFVFLVLLVWATQAMSAMVGLLPELSRRGISLSGNGGEARIGGYDLILCNLDPKPAMQM